MPVCLLNAIADAEGSATQISTHVLQRRQVRVVLLFIQHMPGLCIIGMVMLDTA